MKFSFSLFCVFLIGCASYQSKFNRPYRSYTETLNTRSQLRLVNDSTLFVDAISKDFTYGVSAANPIMLGMTTRSAGFENIKKFLNALEGPNGESIRYERLPPCCPFRTKNGADDRYFRSDFGLLECFDVYPVGQKDAVVLYFNIYDEGPIFAPQGFTVKRQ